MQVTPLPASQPASTTPEAGSRPAGSGSTTSPAGSRPAAAGAPPPKQNHAEDKDEVLVEAEAEDEEMQDAEEDAEEEALEHDPDVDPGKTVARHPSLSAAHSVPVPEPVPPTGQAPEVSGLNVSEDTGLAVSEVPGLGVSGVPATPSQGSGRLASTAEVLGQPAKDISGIVPVADEPSVAVPPNPDHLALPGPRTASAEEAHAEEDIEAEAPQEASNVEAEVQGGLSGEGSQAVEPSEVDTDVSAAAVPQAASPHSEPAGVMGTEQLHDMERADAVHEGLGLAPPLPASWSQSSQDGDLWHPSDKQEDSQW